MARPKPTKRTKKSIEQSLLDRQTPTQEVEPGNEWERLFANVQENPLMYVGGIIFVGLAIVAGLTINLGVAAAKRSEATAFARAMAEADPTLRGEQLEAVVPATGDYGDQVLFAAGNSYYGAGEFDKAGEAFTRLIDEFPQSDLAAEAYEGLGYVAEEKGEFEQALAHYSKAKEYPTAYAAKRQDFNLGRVHERLKDFPSAKAAYEAQEIAFPGSVVAQYASAALDRLRMTYPELFPQEVTAAPQDTVEEPADEEAVEPEITEEPPLE